MDVYRLNDSIYRRLITEMNDGCQIISRDLTYLYLNTSALLQAKKKEDELLFHKMEEVYPGIEHTPLYTKIQYAMEYNVEIQMENEFLYPDGSVGWFELQLQPINEGIMIISRDITEKKIKEQELLESEEKYRNLVNVIPYTIFIQRDGKFAFINEPGLAMYGATSPDELIGKHILDFVLPEDRPMIQKRINTIIHDRKSTPIIKERIVRMDGKVITVEAFASPIPYDERPSGLVICRDITEELANRETILDSAEKIKLTNSILETFINTSPLGIAMVDENDHLTHWNTSAEKTFMARREDFTRPDGSIDASTAPSVFPLIIGDGRNTSRQMQEIQLPRADGRLVDISISTTPLCDDQGSGIGLIAILADISQRKNVERERQIVENRYRKLVDLSPDAIITCVAHKIEYANPAALKLLGIPNEEEIKSHSLRDFLTPESVILYDTYCPYEDQTKDQVEIELDFIDLQARQLTCNAIIAPLPEVSENTIQIILRDITAQKLEEKVLHARLHLLEYANYHTMEELLTTTLDEVEELTHSKIGFYHFVDEETGELRLQEWSTRTKREYCSTEGFDRHYPIEKAGVWVDCVKTREPVIHNDYAGLHHKKGLPPGHAPVTRELVVPVIRQNKIVAILGVGNKETDYDDQDVHVTRLLADLAWEAVALKQSKSDLASSEKKYRELFDNMLEGFAYCQVIYDKEEPVDFVYADTNKSFQTLTGLPDVTGKSFSELFPGLLSVHPELIDIYKRMVQTHQAEKFELEVPQLSRWFSISMFSFEVDTFIAVFDDITTRKQAEIKAEVLLAESHNRLKILESIHSIDLTMISNIHLKTVLDELLKQVMNILKVDAAEIVSVDESTFICKTLAHRGFKSHNFLINQEFLLGSYFTGRSISQNAMVRLDLNEIPQTMTHFLKFLNNEQFVDGFSIPLVSKGIITGALELFNKTPLQPDADWFSFIETVAPHAAIAIDNANLFNNLQRTNLSLSIAYDETIEGWSSALDLRDKETEGHTLRVTELTLALADHFELTDTQKKHIRWGTLLHDIGKMGIPDYILLKPGPLTDDEWKIMRQHPVYAYDLLKRINHLQQAVDIPYSHHEHWDGSGYPRGLSGEEIPFTARLFAIIDVWDALISDRPYRPAWKKSDARAYIIEQSGKQFDPEIVSVFIKFLDSNPTLMD